MGSHMKSSVLNYFKTSYIEGFWKKYNGPYIAEWKMEKIRYIVKTTEKKTTRLERRLRFRN